MAIVNSGFDGTVDEVQYAKMWANGGLDACTGTGWQVAAVDNTTVSVAAGDAFAKGVLSVNDGAINVTVARPASGSTWYIIARRINWSLNQVAAVAVASNTTSSDTTVPTGPPTELLPALLNQPGSQYDHPLAWVWVNSGTGRAIFDLRSQPPATRLQLLDQNVLRLDTNRGTAAQRDAKYGVPSSDPQRLALQGTRWFNTTTGSWQQYYATRSAANPFGATTASWIDDETPIVTTVSADYANGWGTNTNDDAIVYQRRNGWVFWAGILTRTNNTAVGAVYNFPVGFRPPSRYSGFTQASGNVVAELSVRATGEVSILNNKATTGSMTVSASWPAVL